jgi:hypothetical protein
LITPKNISIESVQKISLPKVFFEAGSITAINGGIDIPFEIKRVFYTYDVPGGQDRGGHAHHELYQLVVAGSGAFNLKLDDGKSSKVLELNRPYEGIIIPPGIWGELVNFSSGAIALVLVSDLFKESDYIRDYDDYKSFKDWK